MGVRKRAISQKAYSQRPRTRGMRLGKRTRRPIKDSGSCPMPERTLTKQNARMCIKKMMFCCKEWTLLFIPAAWLA